MKKYILTLFLIFSIATAYAGTASISLSKLQQFRINAVFKQLKIPHGEYKLTVSGSGVRLENISSTEEKIVVKEIVKEVPVEVIKEVVVGPHPVIQMVPAQVETGSVIFTPEDLKYIRLYCMTDSEIESNLWKKDCVFYHVQSKGLLKLP